jgi:acetyltransferase
VLRVQNISDLFYMAEVLAKQPRPRGNRLTILTNAGGPGVLATDALIGGGGALTQLSDQTMKELNGFLPPQWSRNNPVDILGDAGADRYAKALAVAANDDNADGMLVILTPQDMTDATATAEALRPYAQIEGKPVIASWMGGPDVAAGEAILNRAGIPTFPYPDTAAKAFCYMHRYAQNLKLLYETPALGTENHIGAQQKAAAIIEKVRASGRTILTEIESKQLLAAYDIPTVPTEVATTADQAVEIAAKIGYPVVLKIYSETITHKTDVGGVKLNLINAAAVLEAFEAIRSAVVSKAGAKHFQGVAVQKMIRLSDAYEVIVGSSLDPQFGPVILFGSGGQLVEVYKDRALGLPPLNATLARRLMERTAVFTALKGVRGRPPCDLHALEQLLVRFSRLIAEQPWIEELDINPLLINHEQMLALDARVVVHGTSVKEDQLPKLAIRPYPVQYIGTAQMNDGSPVTIRPIRPEDEPLLVTFHQTLSERSVQLRYFAPMNLAARTEHERLIRVCFSDYDRELPLVAIKDGQLIGVGRLSKIPGQTDAEFAILVSDAYQQKGLGTELLKRIVDVARAEKVTRVTADILPDNSAMQKLCEKLGFKLVRDFEDGVVKAAIEL